MTLLLLLDLTLQSVYTHMYFTYLGEFNTSIFFCCHRNGVVLLSSIVDFCRFCCCCSVFCPSDVIYELYIQFLLGLHTCNSFRSSLEGKRFIKCMYINLLSASKLLLGYTAIAINLFPPVILANSSLSVVLAKLSLVICLK